MKQASRRLRTFQISALFFGLLIGHPRAWAGDEVFDARGFNRNRPFVSQLPYEYIDPLNGNLLLVFTDLSLPGNAGFDLKIQRTYNSKIFANQTFGAVDWDSWAGVGWSFHLGRVRTSSDIPSAVEMPDGSSHKLFRNYVGGSSKYVTRDYWIYDRDVNPPQLRLTNGVVYTFGKIVNFGSGNQYRYPTLIRDAFGNEITITYASISQAPDAFDKITQYLGPSSNPGSPKREITFTTETVETRTRLKTMVFSTRMWTYGYTPSDQASRSLLISVKPPVGKSWGYGYNTTAAVKNELVQVTTPNGGTITYTYGTQGGGAGTLQNFFYYGSSVPISARVVATRVTGGRDIAAGTQTYAYAQTTAKNQTIITAPASCTASSPTKTTYTFLGVGDNYATGAVWKIGILSARKTEEGAAILENESVLWRDPASNGNDKISTVSETIGPNTDAGIYAPVVASRTITRGGQAYLTTNTYNSQPYRVGGPNFNDYGRPYRVVETGDAGTRTTDPRTFAYGFTPYIVDRVLNETVNVGGEVFKRSWVYNLPTGFMTAEFGWGQGPTFVSGIHTQYAPTAEGNIGSVTDGNGNVTSYTYDWGVQQNIRTPAYPGVGVDTLQRVINPDGTVQSVTRRLDENGGQGYRTSYLYDALFRITQLTPAAGSLTTWDYDNANGQFVKVTRENSFVQTDLDGFGRPSHTSNAVNVETDIAYDACGRKQYESFPFDSLHPQDTSGTRWQYDGLGRLTKKTNPDNNAPSSVSYSYSGAGLTGIDVQITDEELRRTKQEWIAFGDPNESRLASLTLDVGAGLQQTTSYEYNTLGSLTKVTGVGSPQRSLAYTIRNELATETHPESGLVTYTYDAAGNLATRQDANQAEGAGSPKTFYGYDANNRLTCIDHPPKSTSSALCSTPSIYDVTIGYDRGDNRKSLANVFIASTFEFDGADRLSKRTDATGAESFVTDYTYDGNDNLEALDYPRTGTASRRKITNEYDAGNRVTKVREGTTSYAHTFQYHPSGGAEQFTAGNGLVHGMSFDGRHRISGVKDGTGSPASVLDLTYGYDKVGNVASLNSARPNYGQQTLGVDHLDRLTSASGTLGGSFGYSAVGNMTSKDGVTLTYDGTTNRLDTTSGSLGTRYCYDLNGNITSMGPSTSLCPLSNTTYSYTPSNMLETATVGGVPTKYRYDGDQLRIRRVQGTNVSHFFHGPGGQLLSEFSLPCLGQASTPVRDYIYVGGRLLATIRPSTTPRTAAFTDATSSTGEAAGPVSANVSLTGTPTPCPVSVNFATANGTAVGGSDYSVTSGVLSFSSGVTQLPITVPLINDTFDEDDETFTLTLSNQSGALLGLSLHTATIVDDDPPPTIAINDVTVTEGDAGSLNAVFTISLSAASGKTVSMTYATADGTATAGSDYLASTGTVTFAPGETSRTLNVAVLGDVSDEPNQTFLVNLTSPVNATLADAQGVGTILDNDPPPTISIDDVAVIEHNTFPPRMIFFVTLSAPSDFTVDVNYATSDVTATAGLDYTSSSGTLTFAPGTNALSIPGGLIPDAFKEANETFRVDLSGAANGSIGDGQGIGTILDDEETDFFTITPCRFVDTQGTTALTAGSTRLFPAAGTCGIPASAKAIAVTLTAVNPTAPGYLVLFPAQMQLPLSTSINFNAGAIRSNNAIAVLGGGGQLAVNCGMATGSTHLIIDVFGYFQ